MAENDQEEPSNFEDILKRQTEAMERLGRHFLPDEEEKRFKRLRRLALRSVSLAAITVSGIIGSWELGVYLKESWEVRKLASDYAKVGVELYYSENNVGVAQRFIQKAMELSPDNTDYQTLDAYIDGMAAVRTLFNLDRPYNGEELNKTFEALAKSVLLEQQDPEGAEAYILRGQIYAALKDNVRARDTLAEAIRRDPNSDFAHVRMGVVEYNSGNELKAQIALDRALEINPKSKWALLWKGVIAADKKQTKNSLKWYDKALQVDPRFDLAYYNIGWTYLKSKPKNYKSAEASFRKALALNPDYKEAFYGLGMVFGFQNKYKVAHSYLTGAIKIDDQFLTAWKWRGIVNDEMKDYKASLSDYSKAIELDPSKADIYVRRARVYTKTKSYENALGDLLLAKSLVPNNPRINLYLGQIYFDLDKLDAAQNSLAEAIAKKKRYGEAFALRSQIYEKLGKIELAKEDLDTAVKVTSYRPERFLTKRGDFMLRQKSLVLAANDYAKAHRINPLHAIAWLGEARALFQIKDKNAALAAINGYIRLKPEQAIGATLKERIMGLP